MIDHIAFIVTNLDETSNLLQALGYKELRRTNHHDGAAELEHPNQPGLILEITLQREGEKLGFNHVCFKVDGGETKINSMMANGFPIYGTPHLSAGSGRNIANFKDHDENKWQLTY